MKIFFELGLWVGLSESWSGRGQAPKMSKPICGDKIQLQDIRLELGESWRDKIFITSDLHQCRGQNQLVNGVRRITKSRVGVAPDNSIDGLKTAAVLEWVNFAKVIIPKICRLFEHR